MKKLIRPKVVVSKCLGFEACRYNGEMISDYFVKSLEPFSNFFKRRPPTYPVAPVIKIVSLLIISTQYIHY